MTKHQALRSEPEALRARYDSGAVSPAIYARIKQLEAEIAWLDHGVGADHPVTIRGFSHQPSLSLRRMRELRSPHSII